MKHQHTPILNLRDATFQHADDLRWPNDPPKMAEAVEWLIAANIPVRRVSAVQLKIGPLSLYPLNGTICFDSQKRLPLRGLAGLRKLLERSTTRELPPLP